MMARDEGTNTHSGVRLKENLLALLKRDGPAILLFGVAVIVMTYPLAFRPGEGLPGWQQDPETNLWTPKGDSLSNLWQVWWLGQALKNGLDSNYTPYLFHPNGLDVTFMPHPWTALGTWRTLARLFGDAAGYNLNIMLGLLASAYTAYLLVRHLTDNRAAAWVGGAFFAFYPGHVIRVMHQPSTGSIQWLPLFVLALVAGLRQVVVPRDPRAHLTQRGVAVMVLAGAALSLNAYITIKPWLQAALLGALYIPLIALERGWWRYLAFREAIGVLGLASLLLVQPVTAPYLLAGSDRIEYSISLTDQDLAPKGIDLLAPVKASPELPVLVPRSLAKLIGLPFTRWEEGDSFYLGLFSILLVIAGLVAPVGRRRERVMWLVMALIFWSLSLGTLLHIATQEFPDVWTPYQLVEKNPVFRAARTPHRFALGFSVPWMVLVGYGTADMWKRLENRGLLARAVLGSLSALMLFELAGTPIPIAPLEVSPFYQRLSAEAGEGAIIDLPINRLSSKPYMYLQTIHERPILEGKIGRMPENAYDYVESSRLLSDWDKRKQLKCKYDIGAEAGRLQADGFDYVIVHGPDVPDWLAGYFGTVEAIYQDQLITAFALADLQANPPCRSPADGES